VDECRGSGQIIDCPSGVACDVICSGVAGCQDATINCPAEYPCTVTCSDADSCKNTAINCSTWGGCQLNCQADDHSCESTDLFCGNDACTILCTDINQGGQKPGFAGGTCPNQCDNCTSSGRDC
jgi:hypothetical protein